MKQMLISLGDILPVKPGIIRVTAYTAIRDEDEEVAGPAYEIAMLVDDFTTREEKNGVTEVKMDGVTFMELLTKKVQEMRDTANLAHALMMQDLQWTVNLGELTVETDETRDGMTLAYGEDTE